MSDRSETALHHAEGRALRWALALVALTSLHHVYGAVIYHTPPRYHAAAIAGLAVAGMAAALRASRAAGDDRRNAASWWTFWGVNAVVFALLFGLFEGAYNHLLKNILFLGGLPLHQMRVLFPAPIYEMPNDVFFEITGVLQVLPAALDAYWLGRLLRLRPRRQDSPGMSARKRAPGATG